MTHLYHLVPNCLTRMYFLHSVIMWLFLNNGVLFYANFAYTGDRIEAVQQIWGHSLCANSILATRGALSFWKNSSLEWGSMWLTGKSKQFRGGGKPRIHFNDGVITITLLPTSRAMEYGSKEYDKCICLLVA